MKEILGSACVFASVILAQLNPNMIVLKVRKKNRIADAEGPEDACQSSPPDENNEKNL